MRVKQNTEMNKRIYGQRKGFLKSQRRDERISVYNVIYFFLNTNGTFLLIYWKYL